MAGRVTEAVRPRYFAKALDQMKAANRIADEEFAIAREEAKRRHDVIPMSTGSVLLLQQQQAKYIVALHCVMSGLIFLRDGLSLLLP